MNIEVEKMLPEKLIQLINELNNELLKKENSKGIIDLEIHKEKGKIYCPKCHSEHIKKNGKYKDRQLYKCKDCNKKFNELTDTSFHHTRLKYKQIAEAYDCMVNKLSIRKTTNKIGVSIKIAFILRFKIISCLKQIINNENLKGTKQKNMPRASKRRQRNGTGKSGISKHTICITSGVDEYDTMIFKIAGTSNVSSEMIKNTIGKYIESGSKVIIDCKSSYESVAKEYIWDLKQVKSKGYVDNEGNNLATINALHSELDYFLSGFRGVSTNIYKNI